MKKRHSMIFSIEVVLAVVIALVPIAALVNHYALVSDTILDHSLEVRAQRLMAITTNLLTETPGGVLISKEEALRYTLVRTERPEWDTNYLFPYWPAHPGEELTLPGLTVFDTYIQSPVTLVLHSEKVKKEQLTRAADYIKEYGINPKLESIRLRVEWIKEGRIESTDTGWLPREQGQYEFTRKQAIYYLRVGDPLKETDDKLYLGTITIALKLSK